MEEGKTVEYKKEDIKIVWKPAVCIHAAECIKALPKVYHQRERPWLKNK